MTAKWFGCVLMLSVFSAAQEPNCPVEPGRDGFEVWMQKTGVSEGNAYQAAPARARRIEKGAKELKLGMDRKEVEALLGKPDFVSPGRSPRVVRPSNPDFKPRCWYQWAYYFEKKSPDVFDLEDKSVFLSFSEKGSLFWVAPQNVKEIKAQGSPLGRDSKD